MRLLEVMENKPQCQTQMMITVKRTIAPSSPNTSTKYLKNGLAVSGVKRVVEVLDGKEEG